jgi:archaellin
MELSDTVLTAMVFIAALPVGSYVGINIRTYMQTKRLITESDKDFSEDNLYN